MTEGGSEEGRKEGMNDSRSRSTKPEERRRRIYRSTVRHYLDATYHSATRFRWKYVSEIASSACYVAAVNVFR